MKQKSINEQSDLQQTVIAAGLNDDVLIHISKSKKEPKWILDYRIKAYRHFEKLLKNDRLPTFAKLDLPKIDFQAISYLATLEPKQQKTTDLVELKKGWIDILNQN